MTVCIAALSMWVGPDDVAHPVIILAADRMITARRTREYEFADQTKLLWHRNNLAVLMSGSIDSLLLAYQNAFQRVAPDCTVQELAKAIAEEIQVIRRRDVERLYLQPYNLTLDSFVARQREWTPDFFERLNAHITDSDNDLGEVIIAGFDGNAAHIYTIEQTGWERAWDVTGYCAIGIGAQHAEAEFAQAAYTPRMPWISAMRVTFFAKKRAEEAPGVGYSTDLWWVTDRGGMYLEPQSKVVHELGQMYHRRRMAEIRSRGEDAKQLNAILAEEFDAQTPRAGTQEELERAEPKPEEADAAADSPRISGDAEEGESPD